MSKPQEFLREFAENQLKELLIESDEFFKQFQKALLEELGIDYYGPRRFQRIQLLNFKVLCESFHVSLKYALKKIYPYWAKQKFVRNNLVPNACLSGNISREILAQAVKRDFPNKENINEWKQKQQQKFLLTGKRPHATMPDSIAEYLKAVKQSSRELAKAKASSSNKIRNYRNNPWR